MTISDKTNPKPEGDKGKKAGKAALLLIFLTVFIDLIGFGLVIPALPTYAQQFHASDTTIGLLIAAYSLMQMLFMPFWGRLSDRVGRKPILLISLAFSAVGYLIWGFAGSLALLFVSRMVAGFGNANLAVAQAYITDVTSEEERAKGMGLVGAAFGLGFVLGPAIGSGLTALNLGLSSLGFVAAAISIIDFILTAMLLKEPEGRSNAASQRYGMEPSFYMDALSDRKLRASFALFFLSTFAFANMEATLVLLTNSQFGFDNMQNMIMFTYIGVVMVIVQGGLIHRLVKKVGEKNLITLGTVLVAIGLLLTPVTNNVAVLYVALAILAFGSGINTPANQSILSKLAPAEKAGGIMGVGQSLSTLGRILGPVVGAYAFQHMGSASPYVIGAVVMLSATALSFARPRTETKRASSAASPANS